MENAQAVELLGTVRRVSRDARHVRHGYWFPLLLFGVIILGALPFYRYTLADHSASLTARDAAGPIDRIALGGFPAAHAWGATLFWLVAIPAGTAAVVAFYAVRARRTGVQGRVWPFVVAVLLLFAVLIVTAPGISIVLHAPWLSSWRPIFVFQYGLMPVLVVSLGLFLLARLERSWGLFAISLAFFGVAALANTYYMSNAFYRLDHWIVPDWAANIAVAGGFLVFTGLVSLVALRAGGAVRESSR
jgi:hypothetical protein